MLLVGLVCAVACDGDRDDSGTQPTGDTGVTIVGDDEGSIVLASWLPSGAEPNPEITLQGVFAESRAGVLNLAQCMLDPRAFCVDALPAAPGDTVVPTAFDPTLLAELVTHDVGRNLTLGEWKAPYLSDLNSGAQYYFESFTESDLGAGALALSLPKRGAWGGYEGTADVLVPAQMQVVSPKPLAVQDFFDNAPIELRWAAGNGDVYLHYRTPTQQRLIRLDDTGSYDLDLSSFGLVEGDTVELVLGRWTRATTTVNGNVAELIVQSNQPIIGTWRTLRTELTELYDECSVAETAPSTPEGNYVGTLLGAANDLDPGDGGCTGFPALGVDQILPVDLEDQDLLSVDYQLPLNDASVYIVSDCTDTATCLVGADGQGVGVTEEVVWFNDSGAKQRVYVVLDAFADVTGPFNLDLRIDSLAQEVMMPTCVEALVQGPIEAGSYHGSIAGNADNLQPGCANAPAGGEGMAQIEIPPGATLVADVDAPGGDPVMYLLSNCAIAKSCVLAADTLATSTEQLVYVNASASTQNVYLVLDSAQNLGEYFLDLSVE